MLTSCSAITKTTLLTDNLCTMSEVLVQSVLYNGEQCCIRHNPGQSRTSCGVHSLFLFSSQLKLEITGALTVVASRLYLNLISVVLLNVCTVLNHYLLVTSLVILYSIRVNIQRNLLLLPSVPSQ